jgi:creatinine amidohydrolase/Fe(II)-dependent formamide hydrolase-like protein
LGRDTRAFAVDYWAGLEEAEMAKFLGPAVGYHANIGETSVMLAIDPTSVDLRVAQEGWPPFPKSVRYGDVVHRAYFSCQVGSVLAGLENGTWGDPRAATATLGVELLDAMVASLADVLDEVLAALAPRA